MMSGSPLDKPDLPGSGAFSPSTPQPMTGNPFAADIYPDGLPAGSGAPLVHAGAMSDLKRLVETAGRRSQSGHAGDGGGAVVLLRAPRAGFGKSHLLARLAGEVGDRAFVVAVPFDREREVQW